MIKDVTGVDLIPGSQGKDCPGNGEYADIECCCDECDYALCCMEQYSAVLCAACTDSDCPRSGSIPVRITK